MNFNMDMVPSNFDQAVEILVSSLQPEDIEYIKEHRDEGLHFGLGRFVRNSWSLWEPGFPLGNWFRDKGIGHADDMSGLLMTAMVAKVKNEPFNFDEEADYYKKYWLDKGIDPLTQEQLR